MKNVIIALLTVALIAVAVLAMYQGLEIGNIKILSVTGIMDENDNLNSRVQTLTTLNNTTYNKNLSDLNEAAKKMSTTKTEYLDLASISSDEEIKQANQEKTYAMEYLWSQIGNHATTRGVNIRLEVSSVGGDNRKNMSFTVVGSYIATINFIYDLEDDDDLKFRIEDFKMESSGEETLNSTFTVKDIVIKNEETTTKLNSDGEEQTQEQGGDGTQQSTTQENSNTQDQVAQ